MTRALTLIAATTVALVGFAFHMRNNSPVIVDLFSMKVNTPLSWALVASFVFGVVCGVIAMVWNLTKAKHENRKARRILKKSTF